MQASFRKLMPFMTAAALISASACAATAPRHLSSLQRDLPTARNEPPRIGPTSGSLTGDELRAGAASTLTSAVRLLRHQFFLPTTVVLIDGGTATVGPAVYLNGVYSGGIDALETIPLAAVEEVRYIRSTQARDWWGPKCQCAGGVIHVRTGSLR